MLQPNLVLQTLPVLQVRLVCLVLQKYGMLPAIYLKRVLAMACRAILSIRMKLCLQPEDRARGSNGLQQVPAVLQHGAIAKEDRLHLYHHQARVRIFACLPVRGHGTMEVVVQFKPYSG